MNKYSLYITVFAYVVPNGLKLFGAEAVLVRIQLSAVSAELAEEMAGPSRKLGPGPVGPAVL